MTAVVPPIGPVVEHASRFIAVVVDEAMIPLDRVLGAVRRRNMPLTALSVGPGPEPGTMRVFVQLSADEGDVDRLVRQVRKLVGVRQALVRTGDSGGVRQLALVRLTPPGARRAALVAEAEVHGMRIIAEETHSLELQLAGSPGELERGLRALAPFGILDVARSSPVVLDDAAAAPVSHSSSKQDDRS